MIETEKEFINVYWQEVQTKQDEIAEIELDLLKSKVFVEKRMLELDRTRQEYNEILT